MNRINTFLIFWLFPLFLLAKQPYQATLSVNGASAHVSAPNLVDLKRDLKGENIKELIPLYTPISPVSFAINLRGILAKASFPTGSTTLVVSIPQAGIKDTFSGETRDESITLFKDFIRDGGSHHRLLKAYARYSPIDPIVGNPNSLMAQMGQADYMLGHLSPFSGCDPCWSAQPIVNQIQVGTYVERASSDDFDTTAVTLPLRYSYSPDLNHALIFDAPITYLRNGGASSLVSSLGIGYRYPVFHAWSLTPIIRFGGGGTLDLCTAGAFVSAGITSVYNVKIRNFVFSLTNYGGYISSTNFWLTGVNFNYHLHNYVLKNGISLTTCDAFSLCGKGINLNVSFVDSYFGRERLFIRHYDEMGLTLLIDHLNPCLTYDCLSLGISYQFGQHHYKGFSFNLAYQF